MKKEKLSLVSAAVNTLLFGIFAFLVRAFLYADKDRTRKYSANWNFNYDTFEMLIVILLTILYIATLYFLVLTIIKLIHKLKK